MLSSRSSNIPPSSEDEINRSVVVGNPAEWFDPGGISTPSGGLLFTINDLFKFGVSILNSTLLSPVATEQSLTPTTFTSSISYSIGAPWEIIRYIHPSTQKFTNLYTKLGDSGPYGGNLVLIPEYNAGFSFLNGAANQTVRSAANLAILDRVVEVFLPALESQAAAEAVRNYVGTYVSSDPNINSSVTITFNETIVSGSPPSLRLSGWISTSTNSLRFFAGGQPRLLLC